MADKSAQIILDALNRAALHPEGIALHGNKTTPGLFPATAAAKQAAQRCKDDGLLRVVGTTTRGKTVQEICIITEQGLAHLISKCSPKIVLEDFVRALDARQTQMHELVATARQTQLGIEALRLVAERVLEQIHGKPLPNGATSNGQSAVAWQKIALQQLSRWQAAAGSSEDCPLPALFRQVVQHCPGLSVGQFHDGLRILHERGNIYLHPWTGPMYDMPEPPYALLIGHEVLYYASLRQPQERGAFAAAHAGTIGIPTYEYAASE